MLQVGGRIAGRAVQRCSSLSSAPSTSSLVHLQGYATKPRSAADKKKQEQAVSPAEQQTVAPETQASSPFPASEQPSPSPAPSPLDNVVASDPATSLPQEEAPAPPTSSLQGKEIKPFTSLASEYLDMTEIPAERTGARSTAGKRPMSSSEKRRKNLGRVMLASTTVGLGLYAWHLGREWDSERERERLRKYVTDEEGLNGRWQRGQARFWDTLDYFNKPAWDPLLPDPLPPPHQKPYTLVLSLDDLLIHSSWDREHGWRTAKRPGVDYFLAYLSQFYEIVLFTSQPPYTAIPIVEKLDPHMIYILYKLFRDSTRYHNKEVVKDLSYLGRDLKKVIMLDTDPKHFMSQPENAVHMKPWTGNRDDVDLIGMIPFLEAIFVYKVDDVRNVLKNYQGKHIPTAWAEVEAAQKKALLAEYEANSSSRKGRLGSGISGLFGVSNPQARQSGADEGPKTQLELQRELFQQAYLEEQKYWAENKAAIEKAIEEDKERQKREMTSSVFNFFSAQFGLAPPPGAEGAALATQDAAAQQASKPHENR